MDIYQASPPHKDIPYKIPKHNGTQRPKLSQEKIREIFEKNKIATKQLNKYKQINANSLNIALLHQITKPASQKNHCFWPKH